MIIIRVTNHNICDEKRERLTGQALCAGMGDPLYEIKWKTRETPKTYSTYILYKFAIKLMDMAIYVKSMQYL